MSFEDNKMLAGESIINRRWMVPDNDGQISVGTYRPSLGKR